MLSVVSTPLRKSQVSVEIRPKVVWSPLNDVRFTNFLLLSRWPDLKLVPNTSYLGLPFGASVTLDDVFRGPTTKMRDRLRLLKPALSCLPLHKKILLVNVFVVSLFSYVSLFFILPHTLWKVIKETIRRAITPFNGGAYPYEALVCGSLQLGLKPSLRDVWAAGLSLLAVRSQYFPANSSVTPPFVSLKNCMSIVAHRNCAAYDLWSYQVGRDRLVPAISSKVYKVFVEGYFVPIAEKKWQIKLDSHLHEDPSPVPSTVVSGCTEVTRKSTLSIISHNLLSVRCLPSFLGAFYLFSLTPSLPIVDGATPWGFYVTRLPSVFIATRVTTPSLTCSTLALSSCLLPLPSFG
jgi:hypothetical protein